MTRCPACGCDRQTPDRGAIRCDGCEYIWEPHEIAWLRAQADAMAAALEEWDRYIKKLEFGMSPSDPLTIMRQQTHGRRIAQTRQALADYRVPEKNPGSG